MCYPICIWSNVMKIHPKIKEKPSKKVKFFGFRYRNTLVKVEKVDKVEK